MSMTIYVSILAPFSEEVSWQFRIKQSYTFFSFLCNYFLGLLKYKHTSLHSKPTVLMEMGLKLSMSVILFGMGKVLMAFVCFARGLTESLVMMNPTHSASFLPN